MNACRLRFCRLALSLLAVPAMLCTASAADSPAACPDAGLKLPSGFCATVFADHIGHARHLAVAGNGVVYVNTWSGRYYGNQPAAAGGFLVALQDSVSSG